MNIDNKIPLPNTELKIGELPNEYLTFILGKETYGIDILKVQEIRSYENVTTIANLPAHIKGVVNLRGSIVPIIDLRIKLNLKSVEYNDFTVVIVLNIKNQTIGIVVDRVFDVMEFKSEEMRNVPQLLDTSTKHIDAIAHSEDTMVALVNIEELIDSNEISLIGQSSIQ